MEFKASRKNKLNGLIRFLFLSVTAGLVLSLVFYTFCFGRYLSKNWYSPPQPIEVLINKKLGTEPSGISLFISGDVMLGRTVMTKSLELKDYIYPFRKVAEEIRDSDISFVNLESPVVDSCPHQNTGMIFCTDPSFLEGLTYAGIDVVNLANNHILNYGASGRDQTVKHLEEVNILATGLGKLVKLERNGVVFGFLGFEKSQQVNPKLKQDEIDLITKSDREADILVVSMHWGVEYQDKALPGVRNLAKEIVGYGADLIVGHHPHWVQDYEFIEGKPVFYSLGNFVFDQMWSEETKKGLAVKLIYEDGVLRGHELLPTYMSFWAQPEFVVDN